ncbi:hypothetical protein F5141DRAFT_775196 [Pisolithus sp. B1]|nr:hypothetical protein F5141DRAFT_775196 [Pisolithus sp. B1]
MPFGRALSLLLFPYTHLRRRPLMDLTVRRIYNGVKLSATLLCGRIRGEIWCTRPRGSFPSQREVVGLPSSEIPGEGVTEFAKMKSFGESIRQFTEARWDRASGWDLILDGKINGSAILLYMSDLPTNCILHPLPVDELSRLTQAGPAMDQVSPVSPVLLSIGTSITGSIPVWSSRKFPSLYARSEALILARGATGCP